MDDYHVKIVLVMIVRDESRTFPRLWESIHQTIDAAVICDTGSIDETSEIIRGLLKESGKPGAVVKHEWRDFGWNRTRSYEVARIWARDQNFDLSQTFALLLDADMVLETHPLWKKYLEEHQECSHWEIHQKNGKLNYFNTRLLRMNQEWICQGKTHEVWTGSGKLGQLPSRIAYIQDLGDGGSKSNKFKRDEQLLIAQIQENPNDSRAHFYLAQTYKDLGDPAKSREFYEKCRELNGWDEERWYSKMRIAECSWELGDHGRAIHEAMDAWLERPQRAEPLLRMVGWLRSMPGEGRALAAWHWIEIGEKIPYPNTDRLFIEPAAYQEGWWEEKGIVGFYIGKNKEACEAIEKLLLTRELQMDYKTVRRQNTMRNRLFYSFPRLIQQATQSGEWKVPNDKQGNYCNPCSFINENKELIVCLRRVNYKVNGGKYTYTGQDIFTETDLYNHTKQQYIKTIPVVKNPNIKWNQKIPIWGLEDIRSLPNGKFLATCAHNAGKIGYPRMVIGNLWDENPNNVKELVWDKVHPYLVEKNWLPFEINGKLFAIYSFEPFIILEINEETGECQLYKQHEFPIDARGWRGSTPPCRLQEGIYFHLAEMTAVKNVIGERWGCMIHEVVDVPRGESHRCYWHRWIEWDENGLIAYSIPFIMASEGIEYLMGCFPISNGNEWFMSWGEVDARARWATFPVNKIEN